MTALTEPYPMDQVSSGPVVEMQLQVAASTKILEGQMVSCKTADGYATDPAYGSTGAVLGVASSTADNSSGGNGAMNVNVRLGAFWRPNHGSTPVRQAEVGKVCYASDNNTISRTSTDGPVAGIAVAVDSTMGVLVDMEAGMNYLLSQATLTSNLASNSNALGASLVGIEDSGSFTSQTTVEAALAEIYAHLKSAKGNICFSLHQFREVDANGDVANIAANGGILASDTTPILRGDAAETTEISWATGNADPISTQITLPNDFDGTANATLDLWVYSGSTNAASFTVETGWDGGALVSDTADDTSTKSAIAHKITATIAAADVPDAPSYLTIALTPPTHATDAIQLLGARLNYKKKLTS